jgi:hypothetical protein
MALLSSIYWERNYKCCWGQHGEARSNRASNPTGMAATLFASSTRDRPIERRAASSYRKAIDQAEYDTLTEKTIMFVCNEKHQTMGVGAAALGGGTRNYRSRAPDRMVHQIRCCPLAARSAGVEAAGRGGDARTQPHHGCIVPIGVPQCAVPRSATHYSVAIQGIVSPTITSYITTGGVPIPGQITEIEKLGTIVDDGNNYSTPGAVYVHLAHQPPPRR